MQKARAVVRGYFDRWGECQFYFSQVPDDFYITTGVGARATRDWVACYDPTICFDGCRFEIKTELDRDNTYWDIFEGVYMKVKIYDNCVIVNFAGELYKNNFIQQSFTLPLEYLNKQTVVFEDRDIPLKIEFTVAFVSAYRLEK